MSHPSSPSSIYAAFQRRVIGHADEPFVHHLDGTTWSFGEVDERARAVAQAAAPHLGPDRDRPIGIYAGNEAAAVIGMLMAWRLGRTAAMCGRQLPAASAGELLTGVGCPVIVSAYADLVAEVPVFPVLEQPYRPEDAGPDPSPAIAACICFTSGTTGRPKAVALSHEHLMTQVQRISGGSAFADAVGGQRPLLSFSPFGHSAFISRVALALWIGRGIVLVPKFTVTAAREAIDRYRPRSVALTPTMIHMLATTDDDLDLSSLKWVSSGTAPLREDVRDRFTRRFGVPILQAYGMTELGNIALERLDDVVSGQRPAGSVGRVSRGREVRILDENGQPLEAGVEGEIAVRDTANSDLGATLLPLDRDGYFHTGDRGAFTADGILTITGRASDRIIVGGFNVSPAEVEEALLRTGLIADTVVVGVDDERLGEVPVAAVVWRQPKDEPAVRERLAGSLARYKFPRTFVDVPAIPLTPYGKVDRAAVRRLVQSALDQPFAPIPREGAIRL